MPLTRIMKERIRERITELEAARDRHLASAERQRSNINKFGVIDHLDSLECMKIAMEEVIEAFRKAKQYDDAAFELKTLLKS